MTKEIPIVFGKNLVQIQGSYKKKSGFIKILMNDDDINDFFSGYFENKLAIKKVRVVVEIEENPMIKGAKWKHCLQYYLY